MYVCNRLLQTKYLGIIIEIDRSAITQCVSQTNIDLCLELLVTIRSCTLKLRGKLCPSLTP
jgi:hypothetical protein